jgi:hypothetical protein
MPHAVLEKTELPVKSGFDQVHVASTANEPNLAETPFQGVKRQISATPVSPYDVL